MNISSKFIFFVFHVSTVHKLRSLCMNISAIRIAGGGQTNPRFHKGFQTHDENVHDGVNSGKSKIPLL